MAYLRFHRALKLMPGMRLNLAKTGPSLSLGMNGARVNVSRLGLRSTVGLPGSGLSIIERRSWQDAPSSPAGTMAKPIGGHRRSGLLPLALGGIALTLPGIAIGEPVMVISGVVVAFASFYAMEVTAP
jgi:hypothetical protein